MIGAVFWGLISGLIASIPVAGPMSALVLSRALQGRVTAAFYIALGGGVVEAFYAFIAFWGYAAYVAELEFIEPVSRALGAVIMLGLGLAFVRKKPDRIELTPVERDSRGKSLLVGASMCAMNPTIIVSWSATVTVLHGSNVIDITSERALPYALGIAVGIAAWFAGLIRLVDQHRRRFSPAVLSRTVNIIGVVMLLLSGWFAFQFIRLWYQAAS
ncbi:MAG: LysE family transporter [Myxococcota bacterium]